MENLKSFNKEVANRMKKDEWVKALEHHKDDFDLPAIWEALQEPKKEAAKTK